MNSWRDGASEQAQTDLDRLAEVTIEAAQSFLDRNGSFIPFPMAVKVDGELALIGLTQPDTRDVPDSQDVVAGIVTLFRDRRDSIRALAIGADVRVPDEGSDAIEVRLEHREGVRISVLVPYQLDSLDDSYLYDEPSVYPGEAVIWTD